MILLLSCILKVQAQLDGVVFSNPGGIYDHSFHLVLSCNDPNCHIRYTTNGNTPNACSQCYEEPLFLDRLMYSRSDIYTIQTTPDDLFYVPDSVQHAIVIRAAVFNENDSCISKVSTNTYLIQDLGNGHTLPVVSLCSDSLSLFDYETGILVPGATWNPSDSTTTGNYFQKGKDWERLANFEFIEPGQNCVLNQECGVRTHGNRARLQLNKGMKLYARESLGKSRFNYSFFGESGNDSFKRLVLKPYSALWPHTGVQDQLCNQLALLMGIDAPLSRPVVLYLNGEYWGIYFLQERIDEYYLEDHHPVNAAYCTMIKNWSKEPEFGDADEFLRLMKWLNKHDVKSQRNYDDLCGQIDIENYIDYIILETFAANWDWPANNTRFWKERNGKWQWVFFDGDAAMSDNNFQVFNNISYTGEETWPSSKKTTLLFRSLFENDTFRQKLSQRLDELCTSVFQYAVTSALLTDICHSLSPEVPRQSHRFGSPESMGYWNWGISQIDHFLKIRVNSYQQQFERHLLITEHELHPDHFFCSPNPTSGSFKVVMTDPLSEASEVSVFDLYGRLVMHQTIQPAYDTPIMIEPTWAPGVYVVKIGSHCERIVCQ